MKLKKKKGLIMLTGLLVIGLVGATFAYFTDMETAKNVFTLGKVDINLTEEKVPDGFNPETFDPEDPDTWPDGTDPENPQWPDGFDPGTFDPEDPDTWPKEDYEDPKGVTPGDKISKMPKITIDSGSEDVYLRVEVTITNPSTDPAVAPQVTHESLDYNKDNWKVVSIDGSATHFYMYYIGPTDMILKANDSVYAFTAVNVPESWGNEAADTMIQVDVKAEGIQAENFKPDTKNGVYGWYTKNGDKVEAEKYAVKQ